MRGPGAKVQDIDVSSSPSWLPLAVALVGVSGTLAASILSQRWSWRLEDRRWQRQQDAEEARWKREREDRLAQWEREDRARWLADRRDNYAAALAQYHSLVKALDRANVAGINLVGDKLRELESLRDEWERSCDALRLIAPKAVLDAIWGLDFSIGMFFHSLSHDGSEPKRPASLSSDYVAVYSAMQNDLGLRDGTYALRQSSGS